MSNVLLFVFLILIIVLVYQFILNNIIRPTGEINGYVSDEDIETIEIAELERLEEIERIEEEKRIEAEYRYNVQRLEYEALWEAGVRDSYMKIVKPKDLTLSEKVDLLSDKLLNDFYREKDKDDESEKLFIGSETEFEGVVYKKNKLNLK